jgi:hypothetical protein
VRAPRALLDAHHASCPQAHQTACAVTLSEALHGPVAIAEVFGNIGEQFFEVHVRGEFEGVVRTVNSSAAVEQTFAALAKVPADGAWRVFASLRYMNHARWLAYAAAYPGQFAGEQLLNLNKVLEILLPHSDVDGLREQLRELSLTEEIVQLLAGLAHVRNQVDVGHAAVEVLATREHCDLHRFLVYIMEIVAWLIQHIIERSGDGTFELRPLSVGKSKREKTLVRMGELLDSVDPLRPTTFLRRPAS